jgi:hypothetical protein
VMHFVLETLVISILCSGSFPQEALRHRGPARINYYTSGKLIDKTLTLCGAHQLSLIDFVNVPPQTRPVAPPSTSLFPNGSTKGRSVATTFIWQVEFLPSVQDQELTCAVYDLPADILTTLTRKDDTGGEAQEDITPTSSTDKLVVESRTESSVGSKSCSLCGVTFHTVEDQRGHIRSDLHGYNLKQRLRGAKPVSEGDFEKLVGGIVLCTPFSRFSNT